MGDLAKTVRDLAQFADAAAGEGITIDGSPDPADVRPSAEPDSDEAWVESAAEIQRLTARVAGLEAERDRARAYLIEHVLTPLAAPKVVEPLDDLIGVCTQCDNAATVVRDLRQALRPFAQVSLCSRAIPRPFRRTAGVPRGVL